MEGLAELACKMLFSSVLRHGRMDCVHHLSLSYNEIVMGEGRGQGGAACPEGFALQITLCRSLCAGCAQIPYC